MGKPINRSPWCKPATATGKVQLYDGGGTDTSGAGHVIGWRFGGNTGATFVLRDTDGSGAILGTGQVGVETQGSPVQLQAHHQQPYADGVHVTITGTGVFQAIIRPAGLT